MSMQDYQDHNEAMTAYLNDVMGRAARAPQPRTARQRYDAESLEDRAAAVGEDLRDTGRL